MSEVTKNGDLVLWKITVENNGNMPNTNVKVQDTLPAGFAYSSFKQPTKGTFDVSKGLWSIGTLNVGQVAELTIVYRVADMTEAIEDPAQPGSGIFGFQNSAVVSGDLNDPNAANNTLVRFVTLTTCAPTAGALGNASGGLFGQAGPGDTLCSHGVTEYRIVPGSLVNLDATFDIETDGSYNAMGLMTDPTKPASFQYNIWCVVGTQANQVSGPATVNIPALMAPGAASDSFTDNNDGTFTHVALDGTSVTFDANTGVTEDNVAKTLTFTFPDGTTKVVDISGWFPAVAGGIKSVNPTTIAGDTVLTAATMKNFNKVNDSAGNPIQITLPDPATLPATQEWVFKRINAHTSGGAIILRCPTGAQIDGGSSYAFQNNNFESIMIWTDGANYFIG